jgi:hypothetical protein
MKFGHSGTQKGMIKPQKATFEQYIPSMIVPGRDEWGHGCCIGSDHDGDMFVKFRMNPSIPVHYFPPTDHSKMATYYPDDCDTVHPEEPYIERNHSLVDWADYMIFCPSSMSENWRSGTWATYRYALLQNKPYTIVFPNGTLGRLPK